MERSKSGMKEIAKAGMMMPQESLLEVQKRNNSLYIGIPKETSFQENRISLVPGSVGLLVNNGHEVVLESGAGTCANFSDAEYSEAGARIAYSPEEVFTADIILKVAPPCEKEMEYLKHNQSLLSILQLNTQTDKFFKQLCSKKVTAIAFDYLKDRSGMYPIIQSMSEIAGSASLLIAAEYLSNVNNGRGEMLGGISGIAPTEVVIIGAGTVGEFAARTAIGLGAEVKVFDNSLYKLRRLQNHLGTRLYTSIIVPDTLSKALMTADVAIGALGPIEGRSPVVVTDEMVHKMRSGAVIVDVSIDVGGCFETSVVTNHTQPTFTKYGVIHYCVPNIASRVARTASYALSNVFTPLLLNMAEAGGLEQCIWDDAGLRHGVYLYRGAATNKHIAEKFKLPFKDIDLLRAARI
ncbi:MAG: alanine dehydrogenase [Bacteroidota bacterium]